MRNISRVFLVGLYLLTCGDLLARPDVVNLNQSTWSNMSNMTYRGSVEENLSHIPDSLCYTPKLCFEEHVSSKEIEGFERVCGEWKYKIIEFFPGGGTFTFRIYLSAPNGKTYRSHVLSTDSLPTAPYTLVKLKNPMKGNYLVFIKIESITSAGSIGFLAATSNHRNHSSYIAVNGVSTDPLLVGKKLIMSGFTIPR